MSHVTILPIVFCDAIFCHVYTNLVPATQRRGGVMWQSTTHSCDSCLCVPWLNHRCDMTHSYLLHNPSICVTKMIHVCFTCLTLSTWVPWPIHVCDTNHPPIHRCDRIHSFEIHISIQVIRLIHMSISHVKSSSSASAADKQPQTKKPFFPHN